MKFKNPCKIEKVFSKLFLPDKTTQMSWFSEEKIGVKNLIISLFVKGSVSRDFRPPVFFMTRTHLGP